MKTFLLEHIQCVACGGNLQFATATAAAGLHADLICADCGEVVPLQQGIPVFTPPPDGMVLSEKLARGPEIGTPWRQANWRFLQQQVATFLPDALFLDVGAGRGDFSAVFSGRQCLALDVYPYPEVDLACDLTRVNPLQAGHFDAIVLMNVLEHVFAGQKLLTVLSNLLKPGGKLIVAVPFLVKIHQAPVDFVRYTHFALQQLGQEYGLQVETIEGYYDPLFLLEEALSNLRWSVLPVLHKHQRYLARLLLAGLAAFSSGLGSLVGSGQLQVPAHMRSMAPIGYHIVYRKI